MRCLAPTTCPPLAPTACSELRPTTCGDCPADELPPTPCDQTTSSGGQGLTRTRHALGTAAGVVHIDYNLFAIPDRLDCFYQGILVATTGGLVSGVGALQWTYAPQPGDASWCLVVMSAPTSGTAWEYTLHCPT